MQAAVVSVVVLVSLAGCPSKGRALLDGSVSDATLDASVDASVDAPGTVLDGLVVDAALDAPVDAPGPCPTAGSSCLQQTILRQCTTAGAAPVETICSWGCLAAPTAHCGALVPSGGALTPNDLMPDPALDAVIVGTTTINTETGEITGVRSAGVGVINGIDFAIRNNVGVFRLESIQFDGAVTVTGANAIAIASLADITINSHIQISGDCIGTNAGPGGFRGGAVGANGAGPGGGISGMNTQTHFSGGSGGGHGKVGGAGGASAVTPGPVGGALFGDDAITILRGGGGGAGGPGDGGVGGGGAGAIQLVSNETIRIDQTYGGIEARGCAGRGGSDSGGGGGAGGAILIETPRPLVTRLFVFGGGGGGGGPGATDGYLSAGGNNGSDGGNGGRGGATYHITAYVLEGEEGGASGIYSGGGGGAAGRIRINSTFLFAGGGAIEPPFGFPGTTTTAGLAQTQ